jgi:type I restriction enzyme, S subunit
MPDFPAQKLVVEHVRRMESQIQRLESLYRQKLAALESLKKSLLHQAFTGQL